MSLASSETPEDRVCCNEAHMLLKEALIRLRGWLVSALLFANPEDRFSCVEVDVYYYLDLIIGYNYCSIAPQIEHSFSFLKFYIKVSSH